MDLLLVKIFFEEQTRNVKNTKNDEKSMNLLKKLCVFLCEGCRFESHSWRCVWCIVYAGAIDFVLRWRAWVRILQGDEVCILF